LRIAFLIENLNKFKNYGDKKLIGEFPGKGWTVSGLNKLLRKLRNTGSMRRHQGSGRPRSAHTNDKVDSVNELILSQEGAPKSHKTTRQISRETVIQHSSINHIVRQNLRLKCLKKRRAQELTVANCALHRTCAQKLLRHFPTLAVDFIFFTDEKIFSVAPPVNLQNDCVYVPTMTKKREVAASRLLSTFVHKTDLQQIDNGLCLCVKVGLLRSRVCGARYQGKWRIPYYRDELLSKQLLSAIQHIAGDAFVFQQDSAHLTRLKTRSLFLLMKHLSSSVPIFGP